MEVITKKTRRERERGITNYVVHTKSERSHKSKETNTERDRD